MDPADKPTRDEEPLVGEGSRTGESTLLSVGTTPAPYGGVAHNYLATTVAGPVMGQIMVPNPEYIAPLGRFAKPGGKWRKGSNGKWGREDDGPAENGDCLNPEKKEKYQAAQWTPLVFNAATVVSPCWICNTADNPETLFDPCHCAGMVHRHCFRKWRQGWINPKNYFNCPRCLFSYNIEQIKDSEAESEEKIRRTFRIKLFKLLFMVALLYGLTVAAWAGFCYACDTGSKNIPVAIKYMMTSVVTGVPNSNTTELWESNFKKENVHVWPYYTMFGILLTSIIILLAFCAMGCTFKQNEYRKNRRCCEDCCGGSSNDAWCYMYSPMPNDCDCCSSSPGACCSGGGGGDCKCDGMGEGIIILLLVVIVAIIVSAIFVVIFYTLQKSALLYDRMSAMIMAQARELEGETVVLGKNETWRPLDAV